MGAGEGTEVHGGGWHTEGCSQGRSGGNGVVVILHPTPLPPYSGLRLLSDGFSPTPSFLFPTNREERKGETLRMQTARKVTQQEHNSLDSALHLLQVCPCAPWAGHSRLQSIPASLSGYGAFSALLPPPQHPAAPFTFLWDPALLCVLNK